MLSRFYVSVPISGIIFLSLAKSFIFDLLNPTDVSVPVLWDVNNAVHCLRIGLGVTIISFVPSSVPMLGIIFLSPYRMQQLRDLVDTLVSVPMLWDVNNAVHCLCEGLGVTIISFVPSSVPILGIIFLSHCL